MMYSSFLKFGISCRGTGIATSKTFLLLTALIYYNAFVHFLFQIIFTLNENRQPSHQGLSGPSCVQNSIKIQLKILYCSSPCFSTASHTKPSKIQKFVALHKNNSFMSLLIPKQETTLSCTFLKAYIFLTIIFFIHFGHNLPPLSFLYTISKTIGFVANCSFVTVPNITICSDTTNLRHYCFMLFINGVLFPFKLLFFCLI